MSAILLPRAIRIGARALNDLPAALVQLGLGAPAILTDDYLAGSGALDRLLKILGEAGLPARAYSQIVRRAITTASSALAAAARSIPPRLWPCSPRGAVRCAP